METKIDWKRLEMGEKDWEELKGVIFWEEWSDVNFEELKFVFERSEFYAEN